MSDGAFLIGGGGSPLTPPPPPDSPQRVQFEISEDEFVDGLRRVKFYFPLIEQFLQQVPPEDIPFLVAYLAAAVTAQDKLGAAEIKAFALPFTKYYEELLRLMKEDMGVDDGQFFVLEPLEGNLKGEEDGWQDEGKVQ